MSRRLRQVAWAATILAFCVVIFGAYVRLTHAGLGCPDWPVCYGQITWPDAPQEIAEANAAFPERPVEVGKAWREQVHRMLAGVLGILILAAALMAAPKGRRVVVGLSAGFAAAGTFLYIGGLHTASAVASGLALLTAAYGAVRWTDHPLARLTIGILGVVILQAMLGMWTVTWKLLPLVVTAHLLGGMLTLSLLYWLASRPDRPDPVRAPLVLKAALVVLVAQIALGGWVSTNYAAVACPDFPTCQNDWWPTADYAEGFTLIREIGVDYEGGELDHDARVAIHFVHRLGAIVASAVILLAAFGMWRRGQPIVAGAIGLLLAAQITFGISNVL